MGTLLCAIVNLRGNGHVLDCVILLSRACKAVTALSSPSALIKHTPLAALPSALCHKLRPASHPKWACTALYRGALEMSPKMAMDRGVLTILLTRPLMSEGFTARMRSTNSLTGFLGPADDVSGVWPQPQQSSAARLALQSWPAEQTCTCGRRSESACRCPRWSPLCSPGSSGWPTRLRSWHAPLPHQARPWPQPAPRCK